MSYSFTPRAFRRCCWARSSTMRRFPPAFGTVVSCLFSSCDEGFTFHAFVGSSFLELPFGMFGRRIDSIACVLFPRQSYQVLCAVPRRDAADSSLLHFHRLTLSSSRDGFIEGRSASIWSVSDSFASRSPQPLGL